MVGVDCVVCGVWVMQRGEGQIGRGVAGVALGVFSLF